MSDSVAETVEEKVVFLTPAEAIYGIPPGEIIDKAFSQLPSKSEWKAMGQSGQLDYLHGLWSIAYVAAESDPEETRAALWPYFYRQDSVGQNAVDIIVSLSQLRVIDQPITKANGDYHFSYYGNDFKIDGLEEGEYQAYEVNPGLLGVVKIEEGKKEAVGCLELHPYYFESEKRNHQASLVPFETLFHDELNDDRVVEVEELRAFFEEYNDYFNDNGGLNTYWGFSEGFNIFPVSSKFEFWRTFQKSDDEERTQLINFVRVYGKLGLALFSAFEGNKKQVLALAGFGLKALAEGEEGYDKCNLITLIADQAYTIDAFSFQMVLASHGFDLTGREASVLANKLVGQSHTVVRETADAILQKGDLTEEQINYFENAMGGLGRAYLVLSQLSMSEEAIKGKIPFDLIEAASKVRAGLPGATESYRAILLYFTAQAYANQEGIEPEQVQDFMENLYRETPDLFSAASENTADTIRERERNFNVVHLLTEIPILPVDRTLEIDDFGCGPGWRLMYDLYQRLSERGIEINLTGFDIREIENSIPQMKLVRADLAHLPVEYLGRADLGIENWSSAFDWWLLKGQDSMFFNYVMALRPPEQPLPFAETRKLRAEDILKMAKEGRLENLGGVLMIDRAVPWGEEGSHRPAMKAYHEAHPGAVPGEKAPLGHYQAAFTGEDVPDSLIDDLFRYFARGRELGIVWLNLPADEVGLQALKEELLTRDWLQIDEAEFNDPIKHPFWRTGQGYLKVTAIGVRVGEPAETADPIFRKLLRSTN